MPFIPYGRQNLDRHDEQAVLKTLRSGWITQGPAIPAFEKAISKKTKAKHAVAVANGTVALHLAYRAAGLKAGDEIITAANTFVATSNAALYLGAKPVFTDIEPKHFNLDPEQLEKHVTKKTKAIAVVHFAGHPADMNAIFSFARRRGLMVFEDAAHALGARYHGRPIGSLASTATMFSFHPVKSITTGEGGLLTTPSAALAAKMRLLRSHGVTKDDRGWNVMTDLGFNYRLTDFQAALGTSQLTRLDHFITLRHRVVSWYREYLSDLKDVSLPSEERAVVSAWHLYVLRVKRAVHRDPLYRHLLGKQIGANFHYPPVYWHPYYRRHGYAKTALPVTDHYGRTCITLPLHTLLTKSQVKYIAEHIRSYFRSL